MAGVNSREWEKTTKDHDRRKWLVGRSKLIIGYTGCAIDVIR